MNAAQRRVQHLAPVLVDFFGYSYPSRRVEARSRSHVQCHSRPSDPYNRIPENHSAKYRPGRLIEGVMGKTCGEMSQATALTTAQSRETVEVNESLREAEIHIRDNRADCQNRRDRFTFVIHYLSRSPLSATQKCHKALLYSALCYTWQVVAKGNIIPFASCVPLAWANISAAKPTGETVKTGQTEQVIIRISSARVSGCYQQKSTLPEIERATNYAINY